MDLRQPRAARTAAALVLAMSALLASAAGALASVTFDPATGLGYVGKADVEAAFGWRDQVFQANVRKVSFHAERIVSWSWDCLIDGVVAGVTADQASSWGVGSTALGTAVGKRVTSVTGFTLTGPGAAVASAADPASCPSGDPSNVTPATSDFLYVDYRGQSVAVWSS